MVQWIKEVFIPNAVAAKVDDEKPIVLTLDGHDSHETLEIQQAAYDHNIVILGLPSKMTHKMQPLDVAVFSIVERAWGQHCAKRLAESVKMDRYNVIHGYCAIRHVMVPDLIKMAFCKTGIYPHNPNVFMDED
jgi:hypothetical protein